MKLHLIQLAQKSLLMSYFTRFLDEKSDSQRRRGPERFDFHHRAGETITLETAYKVAICPRENLLYMYADLLSN